MTVAKLLLCICLILQGSHSFNWDNTSPADGLVFYICQGATVTISWQYMLSAGETVGEITWLYNGRSQEMIALQSHGQFIVLPTFSHRVAASGNAGIVLMHVMTGDSGNYSVEVQVFHDSGSSLVLMRRTVVLDVTNMLMTTDGVLHATQMSEPVQDPQTGQWGIRLQCGKFIFPDNPPFYVEWLSPEGNAMNSTDFHDHYFLLDLPQPIRGGNYTCRITPQNAGKACLHGNNTHQGEANTFVDKIDAQLSILMKENQVMKQQQIRLALENQQLEGQLNLTNDELAVTKNELTQTKTEMALGNQQLEVRLNQTNNEVNISQNELTQTNSKLSQTNAELLQAKTELSQTKNELSQTKNELSQAKTELALEYQHLERRLNQTSNELSQTNADLSHMKIELSQTKTELERRLNQTINELSQTTADLSHTKNDLSQTKTELSQTKNELSQATTELTLQNQRLERRLNQTNNDLATTKNELSQAKTEMALENQGLQGRLNLTSSELAINELSQAKTQLSSVNTTLSNRLQRLEDAARHQVAFHATGLESSNPPRYSPLIFNHVVYNQGNAYNANTGTFVAPYPGVYYFIGTTGSYIAMHYVYFFLHVDNTQIAASLSYWDGVNFQESYPSVHGVVHLNAGQRVFINNYNGNTGFDTTELYSQFSGFLLYHDFA